MDGKDELLCILLKCGYMDIDTLIGVMDMSNELLGENLLYDVIEENGWEYFEDGFNPIINCLMTDITYKLVAELDENIENEDNKYIHVLSKFWDGPFANCLDSHFQLESLDGWASGESKGDLLAKLKLDLDWMKEH